MAASVEARVPFAHYPLTRVVNRIPHHIRAPGGTTKPLLKEIAAKYLPHDVVYRRKVGLTLPLDKWMRDEDGMGRYLDLLTDSDCRLAAFAGRGALRRPVEQFRAGQATQGVSLPVLVNAELWLRSLDRLPVGGTGARA